MTSTDNAQFIEEAVQAMNVYRERHQVEPLTHNPQLTDIAQAWADHLASTGTFGHNPSAKYNGERLGENCAMKWTSDRRDFTGNQCVDQWYSEIERYDFQKNSGPSTGHFTQVVWKSSREVGLGRAQAKDGKWLVCANFYPAGNYIGHNAENVLPTRDGKVVLPPKDELKPLKTAVASHDGGSGADEQTSTVASSRSESVKREVRTETVGSGPNAVTKTIITETRTGPDGETHVTTTEKITTKGGDDARPADSDLDKKFRSFGFDDNDDFEKKFRSFGKDDDFDKKFRSFGLRDDASDVSPAATVTPDQPVDEFIKDVIHWHNTYRAKHQAPDLAENKELTELAQKWAEHLASSGVLQHSHDKYRGQPVGENVAAKSGSGHVNYTGQQAVDQWYKESTRFDYSIPEGVPGVQR